MTSKGQVPGSIGTKIIILRIAHGPFASNPTEPRLKLRGTKIVMLSIAYNPFATTWGFPWFSASGDQLWGVSSSSADSRPRARGLLNSCAPFDSAFDFVALYYNKWLNRPERPQAYI